MAEYKGFLVTGVPVDTTSDQLLVQSSATISGVYTLDNTLTYSYGSRTTEYTIDEDKYYKVAFNSTENSAATPYSEPKAGSVILETAPILQISSLNDGVPFSTSDDVYARGNLTSSDVSESDVDYALVISRAFIDLRLNNIHPDLYNAYNNEVKYRKYNALLRLIKDVEINYSLSILYRHLADDKIMENTRNNVQTSENVSVGQTAIGGIEDPKSIDTARYFDALASRYMNAAMTLFNTLLPNYVPLHYTRDASFSGFISRTNGTVSFDFSTGIILDREDL